VRFVQGGADWRPRQCARSIAPGVTDVTPRAVMPWRCVVLAGPGAVVDLRAVRWVEAAWLQVAAADPLRSPADECGAGARSPSPGASVAVAASVPLRCSAGACGLQTAAVDLVALPGADGVAGGGACGRSRLNKLGSSSVLRCSCSAAADGRHRRRSRALASKVTRRCTDVQQSNQHRRCGWMPVAVTARPRYRCASRRCEDACRDGHGDGGAGVEMRRRRLAAVER
jgi:hypothetical protein